MTSSAKLFGSTKLELTEEQLATYQRDGVLFIRKAFDACEVQELGDEADRILESHAHLLNENNLRTRYTPHHETGLPVFEKFDPFVDLSSVARMMVQDERILKPLSAIYGEPACLFKDKLIYKPPGATGAMLHQDWISWPGFPESFITVLVAIDPFTATSARRNSIWASTKVVTCRREIPSIMFWKRVSLRCDLHPWNWNQETWPFSHASSPTAPRLILVVSTDADISSVTTHCPMVETNTSHTMPSSISGFEPDIQNLDVASCTSHDYVVSNHGTKATNRA
ncbi:MAG: phytanoyl-CoA dioxygenase family protein [Pirellulaceae bacterium]